MPPACKIEKNQGKDECCNARQIEKPPYYDAYGDNPKIHSVFCIACLDVVVDFVELEELALELCFRGFWFGHVNLPLFN